jgi:hypothetical protein
MKSNMTIMMSWRLVVIGDTDDSCTILYGVRNNERKIISFNISGELAWLGYCMSKIWRSNLYSSMKNKLTCRRRESLYVLSGM